MGKPFYINKDGSVTQNSFRRTVNNVDWLDFKQIYGRNYSYGDIIATIICIIPIFGCIVLLIALISNYICFNRLFWPIPAISAIQDTSDSIKIYCTKEGKLGLYTKNSRLTPAIFDSVEQLPLSNYPVFIMGYQGNYCLYNHVQRKFLFRNSNMLNYIGDNTVIVTKNGVKSNYSLIGMRLS